MRQKRNLHSWATAVIAFFVSSACILLAPARAQTPRSLPVVMLSDLHFDPYNDPAKLDALRSTDVSQWAAILDRPNSPTQQQSFTTLQKACNARGVDSSWSVVKSSLKQAKTAQPTPVFVTVSGDLLAHNFDCRLRTLAPAANAEDLAAFATRSIQFIALTLRETFPGVPIYMALGNNDSGCADYEETVGSNFLRAASEVLVTNVLNQRSHPPVLPAADNLGDYSASLPHAIKRGRIIVLQDIFASPSYKDCAGQPDSIKASAQIAWLREQLATARHQRKHVWVMAHIPPGVDEYASFHKYLSSPAQLCTIPALTMMLGSDQLAATLTEFSDVVQLALFAHTHMDEMKVLNDGNAHIVPVKIVPSISPVNGNFPAFTVGRINPLTATLTDYTVFTASDANATAWNESYSYASTYKEPDFSAKSVAELTAHFVADRTGSDDASRAYQKWFLSGDTGPYAAGVRALWPTYSCGASQTREAPFRNCMCPASNASALTSTSP